MSGLFATRRISGLPGLPMRDSPDRAQDIMYDAREAPAQLLAEEVDARSDLYAVSVVLYECLTGGLPFEGASPIVLIAKVLHTVAVAPSARDASVPLPLSGLVMRLLDKEPGERPGSARELRELLAGVA